ncbi:hypothetical protein MTO96_030492 [Rhipicephalus appendiculatus]
MAASRSSTERLSRRYPNYPTKCAVIGDSIMRYVHTHFSPNNSTTPCFISYGCAMFSDIPALLEYLSEHADTLLLHVGTTDILKTGAEKSLDSLRETLQRVRQMRSTIKTLHISLPLPRAPNRRRHDSNWRFVSKFNREVQRFSREARRLCHYGMLGAGVFYVEHGFSTLPLQAVPCGRWPACKLRGCRSAGAAHQRSAPRDFGGMEIGTNPLHDELR